VRKVSSTGPDSTVVFVYDQAGHLLGEYDRNGAALREYVWLRDTPMAMFTPDPANPTGEPLVYFIHSDHLNTPRVVVDRQNRVRWRWLAEPFGTSAPETNPSGLGVFTQNLRFPGQYADQESGLFYNYHRYYAADGGRYTQSDPIGLAGGSVSTYGYVGGNPLALIDPEGLQRRNVTPQQIAEFLTPGSYTQPILQANIATLTARIRMYDTNFQYATIAPRGYRYNRQDVGNLTDLLRQYEASAMCTANGLPRPRIDYGSTPNGLPFTRHYGTETGPVRQLPGSVIDEAMGRGAASSNSNGTTTYYDAANNVTVVIGAGGVVSAHRGPPD